MKLKHLIKSILYEQELKTLYYEDSPEYIEALNEFNIKQLYEGLIMTHDINTSISIIKRKFTFLNEILESNNKIKIKLTNKNTKQFNENYNKIEQLLNNLGWYNSNIQYFDGIKIQSEIYNNTTISQLIIKHNFVYIMFEAKYDIEIENKPEIMYHNTPEFYSDKIKKYGLTPRTKNKRYIYPPRVYLCDNINSLIKIAPQLIKYINPKLKIESINFDIFEVNTKHISRLFKDLNFKDGFYTMENIHYKELTLIKIITIPIN